MEGERAFRLRSRWNAFGHTKCILVIQDVFQRSRGEHLKRRSELSARGGVLLY